MTARPMLSWAEAQESRIKLLQRLAKGLRGNPIAQDKIQKVISRIEDDLSAYYDACQLD